MFKCFTIPIFLKCLDVENGLVEESEEIIVDFNLFQED
jgi:hypothetical protein